MTMWSTDIAALYAEEHDRLRRSLMRRGMSAAAAADTVQDTFLKLLRMPGHDVRDPRAYLSRAAGNLSIDASRGETRWRRIFGAAELADAVADPAPSAEASLIQAEHHAGLLKALDELPPRAREVLVLHKLDGLSYADIADRLGISKNTVMAHMVKAMSVLRVHFGVKPPRGG